jgi:hypothetical protein
MAYAIKKMSGIDFAIEIEFLGTFLLFTRHFQLSRYDPFLVGYTKSTYTVT